MKNIANIIYFVRAVEPREPDNEFLSYTFEKELELSRKYDFPTTVLFQYDALIKSEYINIANKYKDICEYGLWFEVVKPLCDACGISWRGRFDWDWHNDVGFLIGYSQDERIKLIDAAFKAFYETFGCYPEVAGSWHIDAFSLNYMAEKYNIIASCNCKEQSGTDGYTLWGGYYNGAYYPSKTNMLCPAASVDSAIKVPVFRMLGADPIYQYDTGLGDPECRQNVYSLEPVYGNSGADKNWVTTYFSENYNKGLNFAYTQLGQENSFGWSKIKDGLEMQYEILANREDKTKPEIMTLGAAGKWFSENYSVTPPLAILFDRDTFNNGNKTAWYYSRRYRINIMYGKSGLYIRDFQLYNENFTEKYLTEKETTHNCGYYNLPVIDGFRFSKNGVKAGLYPYADGKQLFLEGEYISTAENNSITAQIKDKMKITATETELTVECCEKNWYLGISYSKECDAPYIKAEDKELFMGFKGFNKDIFYYSLKLKYGFYKNSGTEYLILPEDGKITFNMQ